MARYQVTIDVTVNDAQRLFHNAMHRAVRNDHMTLDEAKELLNPDGQVDIGACLQMLLDPGSLAGCNIHHSSAEAY
jgi:hypothetical protein